MIQQSKGNRFLNWLFRKGHKGDETVTIAGDIIDHFQFLLETKGRFVAYYWTFWQISGSICGLVRGYIIWRLNMLQNYFKIAWRNLKRNRMYTVINWIGLSIAVAWSVLVFCYVRDEFTFDRFHEHIDRLAIIHAVDKEYDVRFTPHAPLGPALVANSPEVGEAARLVNKDGLVKIGSWLFEETFLGTDPDFFSMFSFPLKWGAIETFTQRPHALYLSDELSRKAFGDDNPVGKVLSLKFDTEFLEFEIAGVFRPLPGASSLTFDGVIHINHLMKEKLNDWNENAPLFIKLASAVEMDDVVARFDEIYRPHLQNLPRAEHLEYRIQPFARYHLHNREAFMTFLKLPNSLGSILILLSIAVLILALASMNYVNLAIANMTQRMKEICIRKVMGAERRQIIQQLLGETSLIILLSLGAGMLLAYLALPSFRLLTEKSVTFISLAKPDFWLFTFGLALTLASLIAVYPALLLSKAEPSKIIQGRHRLTGRNPFSKGLIVFQFAISVFLICVTLTITRQHHYMLNRHFGANLDKVMRISLTNSVSPRLLTRERVYDFRSKIEALPDVSLVSCTEARLAGHATVLTDSEDHHFFVYLNKVDRNFFRTLGLNFKSGALPEETAATSSLIVSEQMVRLFLKGDPIGQTLDNILFSEYWGKPIVGVVEDFNVQSLKSDVNPQVIEVNPDGNFGYLYVRFQGESKQEAITAIKKTYSDLWPDTLFEYVFLSDNVAQLYSQEARWNSIVRISSVVALFIACSGLFGLTLLVIMRRNKEVSIRRVVGATPMQILKLVQRDFIALVLIGNLLAWPVAFFVMRRWLDDFSHRAPLSWWIFASATMIAVFIAVLTVGWQSMNTIRSNPSDNLRDE